MTDLSFNFDKDFNFLHRNSFGEEVDFIFYIKDSLVMFWVNTLNGKIRVVNESTREEVDEWAENSEKRQLTTEEYASHLSDAKILNEKHLDKIQNIIDNLDPKAGEVVTS